MLSRQNALKWHTYYKMHNRMSFVVLKSMCIALIIKEFLECLTNEICFFVLPNKSQYKESIFIFIYVQKS